MEDATKLASRLADLYGSYIDRPNDEQARGSLNDPAFFQAFSTIMPPELGYTAADFGTLQQNPQYRGLRMVLPASGGSYGELVNAEGADLAASGFPRIESQGPPQLPDPMDPHQNGIMRYPPNQPPDNNALQQTFYGEMIKRGFPVLGGTGPMGGDFQDGFNPIGFGAR